MLKKFKILLIYFVNIYILVDEIFSFIVVGELVIYKYFGFGILKMIKSNGVGFFVIIVIFSFFEVYF